jgi:AraC family transcriptional regulator
LKIATIDRWKSRLGKAALLLGSRLDDPPTVHELAAAAAVSPFHFHRIWRALTGETVAQTVLRLRLEASEDLLARGGTSVTDTSEAVGFGTPQSFARAFRRHFGVTPSERRRASQEHRHEKSLPLHVDIVTRGPTLVVALRREGGPYADLHGTFARVWSWAQREGLLARIEDTYGVPLDDPESIPVEQLRYDACLAIANDVSPPAPLHSLALPVGKYALARHLGRYDGLEAVQQQLTGEWLLSSGHEPADFPTFHHFLNDPDETPPDKLAAEVLLPLR